MAQAKKPARRRTKQAAAEKGSRLMDRIRQQTKPQAADEDLLSTAKPVRQTHMHTTCKMYTQRSNAEGSEHVLRRAAIGGLGHAQGILEEGCQSNANLYHALLWVSQRFSGASLTVSYEDLPGTIRIDKS